MKPILVTGAHRSGTTWIGKMLAASPRVAYISEPLNVWHRPGVMRTPVENWYTYICAENEENYLPALIETLQYQYHPWLEMKSIRSLKDFLRMWRDWSIFTKGRLFAQIPLLKDPFAVFSSAWFAERLDCQVVIAIRHPAAVASSLMRLGWSFDFRDLLCQAELMRDWLEPHREAMENLVSNSSDVLGQSCLLWKMIYQVVDLLKEQIPDLIIVRHEDFSSDAVGSFEQLYQMLELGYSPQIEEEINQSSASDNPKGTSQDTVHSYQLDSLANLDNWKRRLSDENIYRVRELVGEGADRYYSEQDWQVSASI